MITLLKTIEAHVDKVWSVSAHPSLPLLVTASTDKKSKLYKLLQRQNFPLVSVLEDAHKRLIRSVAFKPSLTPDDDGANGSSFFDLPVLASGSFDSTISVWGIDEPNEDYDAEELAANLAELLCSPQNEWNLMAIIEGHENEVKGVAWNHSGNKLALCSRDKTVWIWETDPETLEEFECISVLNDHQQDIKHVAWHPRHDMLASSSYDDTVRLYKQDINDDDWMCVGVLSGHKGTVWCSQFEDNRDGDAIRLVSASDDLTVRIWSSTASSGEPEQKHQLPSSIMRPKTQMVWEQECVLPAVHDYPIYSVSWSQHSGRIASAGSDGKIVVYTEAKGDNSLEWSVESIQEASHGVSEINCITWAQLDDKSEVLVSAGDDGHVSIWKA